MGGPQLVDDGGPSAPVELPEPLPQRQPMEENLLPLSDRSISGTQRPSEAIRGNQTLRLRSTCTSRPQPEIENVSGV